ncbi:MAG TPA: hypothetical protein VF832_03765 [Longimicrobiales bacterium]
MRSTLAGAGARELLGRVGFPHPPWAWRLLRSAAFVWLALRAALAFGLRVQHQPAWAPPSAKAVLLLVALPVLLAQLDLRVLRENIFYRNLGARPFWTVLLPLFTAAALEIGADVLLRAGGAP